MIGVSSALGAGLSMLQNYDAAMGPLARANYKMSGKELRRQLEEQYQYQKKYDEWKSALDYRYAQQYAENSAKWNTTGLKAANLNPILAATDGNFRSTFGSPSSGGLSASGSSARGSQAHDAAQSALALENSARQNEMLASQIDQIKAQTKLLEVQTRNAYQTEGLHGTPAAVATALHKLNIPDAVKKVSSYFNSYAPEVNTARKKSGKDVSVLGAIERDGRWRSFTPDYRPSEPRWKRLIKMIMEKSAEYTYGRSRNAIAFP